MNKQELKDYMQLDQKLHYWSQLISLFNRAYAQTTDDDSHTNFIFNHLNRSLYGRWVTLEDKEVTLEFAFSKGDLNLIDHLHQKLWQKNIIGLSFDEVLEALSQVLEKRGFDGAKMYDDLHYSIPNYELEALYKKPHSSAMELWTYWRNLAQHKSFELITLWQCASEIRIWPHHFDTGIYLPYTDKIGIGFGLAMADELTGAPYFYFSAYDLQGGNFPYPFEERLKYGRWVDSKDWKGAVFSIPAIRNSKDLDLFLREVSSLILERIQFN